jgi:hypothetical protein
LVIARFITFNSAAIFEAVLVRHAREIVAFAIIILLFLNSYFALLFRISAVAQSSSEKTLVYEDGFENGVPSWWDLTIGTPTITNETSHSGNFSYVTDEDVDGLYHSFDHSDQIANWEIEIWFYDNMSDSPIYSIIAAEWAPGEVLGILIWSGGEYDSFYGYRYGSSESVSTLPRNLGWHRININHEQNASYILLDDTMLFQANESILFTYFGIGDHWKDQVISVTYYDDVKFWRYYTQISNSSLTIVAAIGGTTVPDVGTYNYATNSTIQVIARPDTNHTLDHWELDNISAGSTNPCTLLMDTNHTLKAVFRLVPTYTLTITTTDGGTTTPLPGTHDYLANSVVQVNAGASPNYYFDHWELDQAKIGNANPCSVNVDADHTLSAFFTHIPFLVSVNSINATIDVGHSLTFFSRTEKAVLPCRYQWYVNRSAVANATLSSWTFKPVEDGTYEVFVEVEDSVNNSARSGVSVVQAKAGLVKDVIDINCIEDTCVSSIGGNWPSDELTVRYEDTGIIKMIFLTFIKFDLSIIPAGAVIDRVNLTLKVKAVGLPLSAWITVWNTTSQEWSESTMGWSNKPLLDTALEGSQVSYADKGRWFSWENPTLMQTVEKTANSGKNLTLALRCGLYSYMEGYVVFDSRESGNCPRLEVSYRQDVTPPTLSNTRILPDQPNPSERIVFGADAFDDMSGVKDVYLCYSIDNGTDWNRILATLNQGSFTASIPQQPKGTVVQYFFEASDNAGNKGQTTIYSNIVKDFPSDNTRNILLIGVAVFTLFLVSFVYIVHRRRISRKKETRSKTCALFGARALLLWRRLDHVLGGLSEEDSWF